MKNVIVNGYKITAEQINSEVQYHPAIDLQQAKYQATQALVIRELLVQRAVELDMCEHDSAIENPDAVLQTLFEQEINLPDADQETCQRFYKNNPNKFHSSPLFEAAHILYIAPPDDEQAQTVALKKAENALVRIRQNPDQFETIAKQESACSSAKMGGRLGQITQGQTSPNFESALFQMSDGELSSTPLATEYGYHIIRVDKRLKGELLPFDTVKQQIADDLARQSWQRVFSQYGQVLAGQADIKGFEFKQADSPLVQ